MADKVALVAMVVKEAPEIIKGGRAVFNDLTDRMGSEFRPSDLSRNTATFLIVNRTKNFTLSFPKTTVRTGGHDASSDGFEPIRPGTTGGLLYQQSNEREPLGMFTDWRITERGGERLDAFLRTRCFLDPTASTDDRPTDVNFSRGRELSEKLETKDKRCYLRIDQRVGRNEKERSETKGQEQRLGAHVRVYAEITEVEQSQGYDDGTGNDFY